MTTDLTILVRELEEQEIRLQFDGFSHDDAWRLGSLLRELAAGRGHPVAIDVTRGDQQLFHATLAGSTADNDDWITRKIRVVRRYEESSYLVGRRHALAGTDFSSATGLSAALYAPHGGSFPVKIRGAGLIGTVSVSGLPQEEDHALLVEAIGLFLQQ